MAKKLSLMEQHQQELAKIDAEIEENSSKARECRRKINKIYETRTFEGQQLDVGQIEEKVSQLTKMEQAYHTEASRLTSNDRHQMLYKIRGIEEDIEQLRFEISQKKSVKTGVEKQKQKYHKEYNPKKYEARMAEYDSELDYIDSVIKQKEQELLETEGDN